MKMFISKLTLSLGLGLFLLGLAEVALAASGPWSALRHLPQAEAGVRLEQPVALAVDAEVKRYYVVDAISGQLISFDQEGQFLTAFTAGGQLQRPVAMVKTAAGSLWVVERATNELLYINPRQQQLRRFAPAYADGTRLFLSTLAVDSQDRLYALDRMKGQVVRLDDNLQVVQEFSGASKGQGFIDFVIRNQQLYALESPGGAVTRMPLSGEDIERVTLSGLQFPTALEVDSQGQLYLLDRHAGTVVVFSSDGEQKYTFLGKGRRPGQLWNGADLLFDWQERLCVVDEGNGRIEIFSR